MVDGSMLLIRGEARILEILERVGLDCLEQLEEPEPITLKELTKQSDTNPSR